MNIATVGVGVYAKNALQYALGAGLAGGIGSVINGESFGQGFAIGAVGGATIRAGGSIVMQKFFGAGLLGNIVTSGGHSMFENAMLGKKADSRYKIFVGPLSIQMSKGAKPKFGVSSLSNVYYLGKAILDPTAKFDLAKTISAGTPVFNGGKDLRGPGRSMGNVIHLGEGGTADAVTASGTYQNIFGHERIHALVQGRLGGGTRGGTDFAHYLSQTTKIFGEGTILPKVLHLLF